MRKFEELEILERYRRLIQKAPLHRRLSAVKNATAEKVRRCVSEAAPCDLAKVFATQCSHEIKEGLNDFEQGRINYLRGKFDEALPQFERAYINGQRRAGLYLGKIHLEHMKRPESALPYFLEAAEKLSMPELYPLIGKIFLVKNDCLKAIAYLEMALKEGNYDIHEELGQLYEQTDQPEKAVKVYEDAFKKGHNFALQQLISLYQNKDDGDARYWAFQSGLNGNDRKRLSMMEGYYAYMEGKISEDNDSAQNGLQRMIDMVMEGTDDSRDLLLDTFIYEGLIENAIELCRILIGQKKKAHSKLVQLYLKLNNFDAAEKVCRDGIKAGETSCIYFMGAICEAKNRNREAIKQYEKSAQGNDYRAYMNMAMLHEKEGNTSKAKENYEYAFLTPAKKLIAPRYLSFLIKNNFFDDAAKIFVALIELKVPEKEIYRILFNVEDAVIRKFCNAALREGHMQAHMWLAQFYILNHDNEKAAAHYRRAAGAGIKEAHVLLAKCLYVQGRFEEAKNEFLNAFRNKINCYRDFAEVLESEGYYDQAILNYRMAVDLGDMQAYENLIMLLIKCGKLREAQITMDLAMKNNVQLGYLYKHLENSEPLGINTDIKNIPPNELN